MNCSRIGLAAMSIVYAPKSKPRPAPLPNISLLRHLLVIENGGLLWSATRRSASVPQLFRPSEPLVVCGWFVMWENDVRHALTFGVWPDSALTRPEPTLLRREFKRANVLFERNNRRLELMAAKRQVA